MKLTYNDIFPVLKEQLPERNNFVPCNYKEELEELIFFGINTTDALEELIKKHLEQLLKIDASVELDEMTYDFFCDEMGKSVIDERVENGYWYSYPALLRLALGLEFGDEYEKYAAKRDNLEE